MVCPNLIVGREPASKRCIPWVLVFLLFPIFGNNLRVKDGVPHRWGNNLGIVTDAERKCCMWSNEKCFGVTECEMTGLGTTHAGCTCPALLGEVENFGNGTLVRMKITWAWDPSTMARMARSVPARIKRKGIGRGTVSIVLGACAVLAGVLCPDPVPKSKKDVKKLAWVQRRALRIIKG